jgi:hypothetical protein
MATKVPQHPLSHGVLEVLQELGGEGGGLVEVEVGVWPLVRIHLDLLKEPVDYSVAETREWGPIDIYKARKVNRA